MIFSSNKARFLKPITKSVVETLDVSLGYLVPNINNSKEADKYLVYVFFDAFKSKLQAVL